MNPYTFSAIIITHAAELEIIKTIESVINQTLDFEDNIEIVIVDSGDGKTGNICREYFDKYPDNFKYIFNENITTPEAKNLGVKNASGKYLTFIEVNDYYSDDTFNEVSNLINKSPKVSLISIPIKYYKNNQLEHYLDYKIGKTEIVDVLKQPKYAQLLSKSCFFKRESVQNIEFVNSLKSHITFLSNVLIDNTIMGICKNGTYFMENIEEKILPTEDFEINSGEYFKYIEDNFNRLISKAENKFGEIPEFLKYILLNQFKWISAISESKDDIDLFPLAKIISDVDDEIILNNILLEIDAKILAFVLKYDNNISEDLKNKLGLNTAFIDIYEIVDNTLHIFGHLINVNDRDIEILVNGERVEVKPVRFPQNDKRSLGHIYTHDYSFKTFIPLSKDKKYEIEFKSENKKLSIDFSRPCNFSRFVGYAKTKHFISILEGNSILVKRKTTLNWIRQEVKAIVNMAKNRYPGFAKAVPFRIAYMIGYPFLKNKKIWFFMDRPNESDDNGLHLFKYAVKQDSDIKKYFVLSSDNEDFNEIKKIGSVLPYKSLKHRYLGMFVQNIVTSHPDNEIIYPFWGGYPYFAGLLKSNNVFLQHGILKDNISSWLNKSSMNLSFFLVSSKKEYDSVFRYPYNYEKKVVKLEGLPRYDNLKNTETKKQIIIMPSWRRNLTGKSNEYIRETEYFQRFNSLINNEKFIEKAREFGYEIIYRPHPKVYNFIELFDENDYVKIDYDKTKFQTLFNNGSLMITDYSSVAFDFAYLYKPVIYYQYGDDYHFDVKNSFYDYETMGLGEIRKDEDELVDLVIEYMENDCKIKEEYENRIKDFFIFTDNNNCKRVYDKIKKVPLKD